MSRTETRLLSFLRLNAGTVVSRAELLVNVWDASADCITRTVDMHIVRVRRHLNDGETIETVRGIGYVLTVR